MTKIHVPAQLPGVPPIFWTGHSIGYIGASTGMGMAQKLADLLQTDLEMRAIGGASLAINGGFGVGLGAGGWDHLARFTDTQNTGAEGEQTGKRGPAVILQGTNDLGNGSAAGAPIAGAVTATHLASLFHAFRWAISRLISTAVYEDTSSWFGTQANWSKGIAAGSNAPGSVNQASGGTRAECTVAGSALPINLPGGAKGFQGGTLAIGFLANPTGAGALFDVSVDGANRVGVIDTRNAYTTSSAGGFAWWTPQVYRITDLAPGAHTILVTPTAITGTAYVDCVWTESPTAQCAVCNQYRYSSFDIVSTFASGATSITTSGLTAGAVQTGDEARNISGPGIRPGTKLLDVTSTTAVLARTVAMVGTSGSPNVTAAGPFVAADVGQAITGTNIPGGTVLQSFDPAARTAVLSNPLGGNIAASQVNRIAMPTLSAQTAATITVHRANPDSDVVLMNTNLAAIVAEFTPQNPNVALVDLDAVIQKNQRYFALTDPVHPNDDGAAACAEAIRAALRRTTPTRVTQAGSALKPAYISRTPNDAKRNVIEAAFSVTPLTVRGSRAMDGQTADLLRVEDGTLTQLFGLSKRGGLKFPGLGNPVIDGRLNFGVVQGTVVTASADFTFAPVTHNLGHTFTATAASGATALTGVTGLTTDDNGRLVYGAGITDGTTLSGINVAAGTATLSAPTTGVLTAQTCHVVPLLIPFNDSTASLFFAPIPGIFTMTATTATLQVHNKVGSMGIGTKLTLGWLAIG